MKITENFTYIGTSQNFERDSYATLAEMKAVVDKRMPDIFTATCKETGKLYIYNKNNEVDETLGKWKELSIDGDDYVTKTYLDTEIAKKADTDHTHTTVNGHTVESDVPVDAKFTDTIYDDTDIKAEIAKKADITSIPSKVSELTNDSNYQTAEQISSTVTAEIAKVVADAPENFDTLKEMSDWIAGHEDDASAMNSAISDNKTAITALQSGKADKSEIPTTVSELTDSSNYAKKTDIPTTLPASGGNADTVNNHTVKTDVPENAVFTDTIYDDTEVKENIEELSSNLDTLEFGEIAGSKNHVYKTIKNANIETNGTIIATKETTDIHVAKVESGKTYTLTADSTVYAFYSVEPNLGIKSYDSSRVTNGSRTITIPSGVSYLAFRTLNTYTTPMVNEGSTSLPYEPYIPSIKMLNESIDTLINDTASSTASTYSSSKIDKKLNGTSIKVPHDASGFLYYSIAYSDSYIDSGNQGILIQHNRLNFSPITYLFTGTKFKSTESRCSITKISGNTDKAIYSSYAIDFYLDKEAGILYLKIPTYSSVSLTDLLVQSNEITATKVDAIPDTATKMTVIEYASTASLANYSIPLNLYMGTNHYLAIKVKVHDMNYYFNISDRSGNIYEGIFFSYNGSFSVQITKINNSLTKIGYALGFRQYKVSSTEFYLVMKVSDYTYINGVINTSSALKSNIEIIVNDDSTLWDSGTDIVVKEVGYINDTTSSTMSTYSSAKIDKLLVKREYRLLAEVSKEKSGTFTNIDFSGYSQIVITLFNGEIEPVLLKFEAIPGLPFSFKVFNASTVKYDYSLVLDGFTSYSTNVTFTHNETTKKIDGCEIVQNETGYNNCITRIYGIS